MLRVFEENKIPIDYIAGTSVGALIAAAFAGGSTLAEMEKIGLSTRFKDFAEWTISWKGLASDTRLQRYLRRLTPVRRFEDLKIPLTIAAALAVFAFANREFRTAPALIVGGLVVGAVIVAGARSARQKCSLARNCLMQEKM